MPLPQRGRVRHAIHAVALTRMRSCPQTRAYLARRTAEGKAAREICRCLQRYIARKLFRQLTRSMKPLTKPLTNIEASAGPRMVRRGATALRFLCVVRLGRRW